MRVEFSTKDNPTLRRSVNATEFLVDNHQTTIFVADKELDLGLGFTVDFDGGAQGLGIHIPHDQLEDFSWTPE